MNCLFVIGEFGVGFWDRDANCGDDFVGGEVDVVGFIFVVEGVNGDVLCCVGFYDV